MGCPERYGISDDWFFDSCIMVYVQDDPKAEIEPQIFSKKIDSETEECFETRSVFEFFFVEIESSRGN